MKKILLFLLFNTSLFILNAVKVIPIKPWHKDNFSLEWQSNGGLTYTSTIWGETYYNPDWQDMDKSSSVNYKTIEKYFYAKPPMPKPWKFVLPISNLNAKENCAYSAQSTSNLKQNVNQIYWGFNINFKANGKNHNINIRLKRNGHYISYNINGSGWKKEEFYTSVYPSCELSNSSKLEIITSNEYSIGTTLYWAGYKLTSFDYFMEELNYITVYIGTQAKVQIGKPSARETTASRTNNDIYGAEDLIEKGDYISAKNYLYNKHGVYYEKKAVNLTLCYLALGEFDNCISMCNALIKYKGESLLLAYYLRGVSYEKKGNYEKALVNYQKSSSIGIDDYQRLYNEVNSMKKSTTTTAIPPTAPHKKEIPKLTK